MKCNRISGIHKRGELMNYAFKIFLATIVITLGFTSSSFADITGVWCGKAVEKQEYCKGDEAGFLNVKQVGVGLSGDKCEDYRSDCLQIRGGEVSDKNVTFSLIFEKKGFQTATYNLRLLDDNYLKGTVFVSYCNCDFPVSFL